MKRTTLKAVNQPAPLGEALKRGAFDLPAGVTYLDGNSLGPLPAHVGKVLAATVETEWGAMLIRAWNDAGWIDLPRTVGDRIGRLVGAPEGSLLVGDTTSVNLFKALNAALDLVPERKVILSDTGNFPTDLYIAEGVAAARDGVVLETVSPEAVASTIDDRVAVLMLTQIDYRTGRMHDMAVLTRKAHEAGALTVWDLAHSTGAVPVDLAGAEADFAVGCSYKYLNGGPGAPGFIQVAPRHAERIAPRLSGWLGHEAPFAFEPGYRPAEGAARMVVGTPPILSLRALDAALDVWEGVAMEEVRTRSTGLTRHFIEEVEGRCGDLGVRLASPRESELRGSQVSFRHEEGFAVMQALIDQGVIGDFRAPDLMRFGFAPLYNGGDDVLRAAGTLERVLRECLWDAPRFRRRGKVT